MRSSPTPRTVSPGVMLAALVAVFAMSQAFRTVATLVAVPVRTELGIPPDALGLFAGTFHLAFGLMQLPLGVAFDLWGARRTVVVGSLAAIAGGMLAAWAPSFGWLVAGQFLIGVGCAPAFLGCLVFIGRRYPAARFTALSGAVLGFGGLGLLLTGTPLAWVVEHGSWRMGFVALTVVTVLAWIAVVALVREPPLARHARRETLGDAIRGLAAIMRRPCMAGMMLYGAVTYASFISLRGLWLVPLLVDRHGYTLVQSGNIALIGSIISIIAPPLYGRFDPRGRRRRAWLGAIGVVYVLSFAVLATGIGTAALDVAITFLLSFLCGAFLLQYADVREAFEPEVAGRALAAFNCAMFLGVALMQWASGVAASAGAAHGVDPLASVFATIAVMVGAGAVSFWWMPWPPALARRDAERREAATRDVAER